MRHCTFRIPGPADVDNLFDCVIPYAAMSWQVKQAPVDEFTVRQSLYNIVLATNFMKIIAEIDGEMVGVALGYWGTSWWSNPDGGFDLLYVTENAKGTDAARGMVRNALLQFKSKDCGFVYSGAESDISDRNTRLYENLFKKQGFRDIGGGRMIIDLRRYDTNLNLMGE